MNILHYLSVPLHTILFLFVAFICLRSIFKLELLRWTNPRISERVQSITVFIGRILCLTAAGLIIWFSIPYLKDDYFLITNKYQVTEGFVAGKYNKHRDLNEYVVVKGKTIEFLFGSGMEVGKKYEVKYLPHTYTGIHIRTIN